MESNESSASDQTGVTNTTTESSPSSPATADDTTATTATTSTTATTMTTTTTSATKPSPNPQQPAANNRSILILRYIDQKTPAKAVMDIFDSENCPSKPVQCEYALRDSWYVTFKNDEDAAAALAYIRKGIIKWNNKPIMVGFKSKPAAPSTSNYQPPRPATNIVPPMVMQDTTGLISTTRQDEASIASTTSANVQDTPSAPVVMYHHPNQQQHHHHNPHPHLYGYSAVAYYGSSIPNPWHYMSAPARYELSEVFTMNGLTPYSSAVARSANDSNNNSSNSKLMSGDGQVSSASLLGSPGSISNDNIEMSVASNQRRHPQRRRPHSNHHHHVASNE